MAFGLGIAHRLILATAAIAVLFVLLRWSLA